MDEQQLARLREKARYFRTKQYYRQRKAHWEAKQKVSIRLDHGLWIAFGHFHSKKRSELIQEFVIDEVLYAAINKRGVDGLDTVDEVRLRDAGLWETVRAHEDAGVIADLQESLAKKNDELKVLQEKLSKYTVFDSRAYL